MKTAVRTANVELRGDDAFHADLDFTLGRANDLAIRFTELLATGVREVYFADTDILADHAFNSGETAECRELIRDFCRGVFEFRGQVPNHALPFLCRANPRWDVEWGESGKKRGFVYEEEKDAWKNAGLRLIELGRFPVVDCPSLGFVAPNVRNLACSTLFNVIAKLDSTRKAMLRRLAERRQMEEDLVRRRRELDGLGDRIDQFGAALERAESSGLVRVNGRLIRHWKNFRRGRGAQDCYATFFEELNQLGLAEDAVDLFECVMLKRDLDSLRTPTPRLPGIDYPVDLHFGIGTSIFLKPKVVARRLDRRPRRHRERDSYSTMIFTVRLLSGDDSDRQHTVESRYSGYFEELEVEPVGSNVGLTFSKNAESRPIRAVLKEFDIGRGDAGRVLARLAHHVQLDDAYAGRRWAAEWFSGLRVSGEFPAEVITPGRRVMSVDLGINPLFAWGITEYLGDVHEFDAEFEVFGGGRARIVENRSFRRTFAEDEKAVREFSDRVRVGRQLLGYYRRLFRGQEIVDRWIPRDHLALLGLEVSASADEIREALAEHVSRLRRGYRRLREARPGHGCACLAQYMWATAVGDFVSLLKGWSRKHRDPQDRDATYQDRDFESYHAYRRNLRTDLCRKIADEIVKVADDHAVAIVVIEKLQGFRPSQRRQRAGNRMLAGWARARVVEHLRTALESRSIALAEVDPRHTSQKDPLTGDWGHRDEKWKDNLFVRREGTIVRCNSDEAAALNLARRFWCRGTEFDYVKVRERESGVLVPVSRSHTLKRAANKHLGRSEFVFDRATDDRITPRAVSAAEFRRYEAEPNRGRELHLFRHGDEWVGSDEHYSRIGTLFAEFLASRAGEPVEAVTTAALEG